MNRLDYKEKDMITLKECFQYSKYLSELLNDACTGLINYGFSMNIVEYHNRSRANKDGEDEYVQVEKTVFPNIKPNQLIDFVGDVIKEIDAVSDAIDDAKSGTEFDKLVMINSKKHQALSAFEAMLQFKSSEKTNVGVAYNYNAEGNQVPYKYDIRVITEIDFDRNDVRGIVNKLRKETAATSTKIDELQLMKVDFEPKFTIGDSVEDILCS